MCDINKYNQKLSELEDYLDYVNTTIDRWFAWELELYAAYAAHKDLVISTIARWYWEAEDNYVTAYDPSLYLCSKYNIWTSDQIDFYYNKEVFQDGTLFECMGYWFKTE